MLFLPSRCLATIGGVVPSRYLSTIRGFLPSRCLATIRGDTQTHTHRQQRDLISLLLFFQNKEIRLKLIKDKLFFIKLRKKLFPVEFQRASSTKSIGLCHYSVVVYVSK
jgi:hypothetical protein